MFKANRLTSVRSCDSRLFSPEILIFVINYHQNDDHVESKDKNESKIAHIKFSDLIISVLRVSFAFTAVSGICSFINAKRLSMAGLIGPKTGTCIEQGKK